MTFSFSEKEIDPIDFPNWLAAQDLFPKFYQKCRKTGTETVALGSCMDFFEIPRFPQEKLFGVLSFPSQQKSAIWNDFQAPFFFLPQVEIIQSLHKTVMKIRGTVPTFNTAVTNLPYPTLSDQVNLPCFEKWTESVEDILKSIESKEMQKVVLARMSTFQMEDPPFAWLKMLLDSALNSTVFAFQMNPSSLFLGATPEMLYQKQGRHLNTESIAGTRKRGNSPLEDTQIGIELQKSIKEKKEFSFVKNFLGNSLSSLCEKFSYEPSDSLIQTSQVQHLYNRLEGVLKLDVSDFDILSLLHPTPAVGALPKKIGIEKILSLEPFDRGLYAGTMGWMSPLESSFAVTIRSALITQKHLHAFAGTGIVEGSDAKKEWLELEDKISHWKTLCPIHP